MPLQKCFIFKKIYVKDHFDKYRSHKLHILLLN